METIMYECVTCGWLGHHEQKGKRRDGWAVTDVCPSCGEESFYKSITKALPCDVCGENVLVQEKVDVPFDAIICGKCHTSMMSDDTCEAEEFDRCSQCDGHDACADFGCAIVAGFRQEPEY